MCAIRPLHLLAGFAALSIATPLPAAEPDKVALAQKAQAVLKTHCYRCHGEAGAVEGGMNFILDLDKLVERRKVVAGNPDKSPLYKRLLNDSMPPPDATSRPSDADKGVLKEWIAAGAPGLGNSRTHGFIAPSEINDAILADLEKIDRRARRFARYFTFTHLYNAGLGDDELQTYRNALSKLVNSLSWHPKVRVPEPVDAHATILRIDLRWFMWDAPLWNRILNDYPYGILDDSTTSRAIMVSTASRVPAVRGDWFVATASRPPLYQEVLQLPGSLAELERQLRVDPAINITQERVIRVAFNGSGISKNNRILERHDAVHGYYWRTYDFEEVPQNLIERGLLAPDRRNVFAYPLGPGNLDNTFQHAGGEAIFSLPNGLQGYYIMNAVNNRLDKAPVNIVSDPKRPDRAVELGISCIGCHVPGIHAKADQMRDHLDKNPRAWPKTDYEFAKALYPPKERSLAQMEEDARQFQAALAKTGVKPAKNEPVIAMTLRYEGDLDAVAAAAEAGMKLDDFQKGVAGSELLSRNLGALGVPGGTVHRPVWVQAFGDVVRELKLGVLFQANQLSGSLPDNTGDLDPLEVTIGQSNHMAFSADGRRAVIASADRSVRYYETEGRRDLKRFIGHTASVWSVALSRDGKWALSGSMDGSVRLWRVEDAQQLFKLDGHNSLVAAVAFAPDGRRAVSGGFDGVAILWDLEKGRELQRLEGPARYVNAVAVAPDGKHALVAADKRIWLWDLEKGDTVRTFEGHSGAVATVAFSPDGTRAASGGDDRTLRLWDVASGKQLHQFNGHASHVKSVAFNESGTWLLSGGADATVRLWQAATGQELAAFRKHAEPVVQVAFLDNGKQTLSGSRDTALLLWSIEKSYPAKSPVPKEAAQPTEALPVTPAKVDAVDGTIGSLLLAPDGKWLYAFDRTSGILIQYEPPNLRVRNESRLDGVVALALSLDGKTLYAAARGTKPESTTVLHVDADTLKARAFVDAIDKFTPHDVVVAGDGALFLSYGSGRRQPTSELCVWDPVNQMLARREECGIRGDSALAVARRGGRLFAMQQGYRLQPVVEVFQRRGEDKYTTVTAGPTDAYPFGWSCFVTPDERFLVSGAGAVLWLDASARSEAPKPLGNGPRDLDPVAKVDPFLCAVVDVKNGVLHTATTDGLLKQYTYPDFKPRSTHRLGVTAYQMVLDAAGRLYLAVIDPRAVQARPRAKGFGDIWMIELKDLPRQ